MNVEKWVVFPESLGNQVIYHIIQSSLTGRLLYPTLTKKSGKTLSYEIIGFQIELYYFTSSMAGLLQIVNLLVNIPTTNTQLLFTSKVKVLEKCNRQLLCISCLLSLGTRKRDIADIASPPGILKGILIGKWNN